MTSSIKAYNQVCKHLDLKPIKITETIPEVAGATTVIVPNKLFSNKKLTLLANKFGEDQPYKTYSYDIYDNYTDKELCGIPQGKTAFRVIYMQNEFDKRLKSSVKDQLETYKNNPELKIPTHLEALCFYFTLCQAGKTLNFDSTYIRHVDLAPVDFFVPDVDVGDDGQLGRGSSSVGGVYPGRALVVKNSTLDSPFVSSSTAPLSSDLAANTAALNKLTDVLERIYHA